MDKNEKYFKLWIKLQIKLVEDLLISGAPYFDVLEIISTSISFKNGAAWYSAPAPLVLDNIEA